jgi:hypothetical protein
LQKLETLFKKFWHRRAAKKSLLTSLEEKQLGLSFKVKHVRVLLDSSLEIEQQFFNELAKAFGIPPVNVSVFAFRASKEIEKQYAHFFDLEEVTYFGKFEGDLALICEKEVDLQINYFNRKDLYMEWVSSHAKKKLSVGFSSVDQRLNDLIFDFSPTDKVTFKKELVKYLTILKKL